MIIDTNILKNVDDIIDLYNEYGAKNYIGEGVTQTQHSIQAALLAREESGDEEAVVAALLHDIGHLLGMKYNLEDMKDLRCLYHEYVGSEALMRAGLNEKICFLIRNHVNAKRYLVTMSQEYYDNLSESSKRTLNYQGGIMLEQELSDFENNPLFELIIKMRKWDEKAKVKDMAIPEFKEFREVIEKFISH